MLLIHLNEIEAILCTPSIAAILKIFEVVAMPNDAQGVHLTEPNAECGGVDEVAQTGRFLKGASLSIADWYDCPFARDSEQSADSDGTWVVLSPTVVIGFCKLPP